MGIRAAGLLALVAVLACAGAADKPTGAKKADARKADTNQDAAPACMHCGATCGLEPVCVCEPGTKKRPKVEFDATCEPICIPRCGSHAGSGRGRTGCTSCGEDPCACRSRVRLVRKLQKETTDEAVPTTVRTVRYVCDRCAGHGGTGCCGAGPRPPSWWANLTGWWPRTPAR